MKIISSSFTFVLVISFTIGLRGSSTADKHGDFLQCLSLHSTNSTDSISNLIYTPINSSYSSVLNFSIKNLRFSTPNTPKPLIIITPTHPSHVQASVICSKLHGLQIRTRSGGHDFEGLFYISDVPFIIVDFINLRSITINTESSTAWVQSGATLGELYYRIAEKSRTLAFPAGLCPTVGVGGHFSGGGYEVLLRKYGLAADNVIDAYLVDANGKVLDRKSMGEDLFWALRGGGGGSFGIVVAWKIKLVAVPATVTVLKVSRSLDEKIAKVIHRWQYVASKLDENVFIAVLLATGTSNSGQEAGRRSMESLFRTGINSREEAARRRSVEVFFLSLFLGKADQLLSIVQTNFPELGLVKEDCQEMSWAKSVIFFAGIINTGPFTKLEDLLNRTLGLSVGSYKLKSDYVNEPISEAGLEGLWEWLRSEEIEIGQIFLIPYGGKMVEISESSTPFPHRSGCPFKISYMVQWRERGGDDADRHIRWSREVYRYMTGFVSKSPRGAYVNYRDLDIGTNKQHGEVTSYKQASVWGLKYFGKSNFNRLVVVKSKVDPHNFFTHEQSIPPSLVN